MLEEHELVVKEAEALLAEWDAPRPKVMQTVMIPRPPPYDAVAAMQHMQALNREHAAEAERINGRPPRLNPIQRWENTLRALEQVDVQKLTPARKRRMHSVPMTPQGKDAVYWLQSYRTVCSECYDLEVENELLRKRLKDLTN